MSCGTAGCWTPGVASSAHVAQERNHDARLRATGRSCDGFVQGASRARVSYLASVSVIIKNPGKHLALAIYLSLQQEPLLKDLKAWF